jgi:hypothetical protein
MESFKKTLNEKVIDGNLKNAINSTINSAVYEGNLDIKDAEYDRADKQQQNTFALIKANLANDVKSYELETDPALKAEKKKKLDSNDAYMQKYLNRIKPSARGVNQPAMSMEEKINTQNQWQQLKSEANINATYSKAAVDPTMLSKIEDLSNYNNADKKTALESDSSLAGLIGYKTTYDKNGRAIQTYDENLTNYNIERAKKNIPSIQNNIYGAGELSQMQIAENNMNQIVVDLDRDFMKNESNTIIGSSFNADVKSSQTALTKLKMNYDLYLNQYGSNLTDQQKSFAKQQYENNKQKIMLKTLTKYNTNEKGDIKVNGVRKSNGFVQTLMETNEEQIERNKNNKKFDKNIHLIRNGDGTWNENAYNYFMNYNI